jgi:3-oxoacyl-[acyl-carrier protein] reductase
MLCWELGLYSIFSGNGSVDTAATHRSLLMQTGLKNRIALVAASSQGIGLATARGFAAEGCRLALCARNEERIQQVAEDLRKQYGVPVIARALDVGNYDGVSRFVAETAAEFGAVDICVTNAGGPPAKGFLATTMDDWANAARLNLFSIVAFAHAVIPHMQKKRWGRFITLTSVSVRQPVPDLVLSNSIRAGVVGLIKSLSNEFGKDGILFNNVGPGFTATDRLKELAAARSRNGTMTQEQIFDGWAQDSAVKRLGEPNEVADAIVWLASDRASYITGQTVLVDGGAYKGL